jgi:endonuclease-3
LVRSFGVPMADRISIDISPDVQVGRVMHRLGLIEDPKDATQVVYAARELNPAYPGKFDALMWDTGNKICRPRDPRCGLCKFAVVCRSRLS